jgi:hypothetical protein
VRIVVLGVIVAVSLVTRVVLLLERPLWHDELFTAWVSRLALPHLVEALSSDSGPPLFYIFEGPFARADASPRRDPLLRLLPFAAALALFVAARWLPNDRSRAWWIALCAGSALVNLYSAEARAYAPLSLAVFAAFGLGVVARETPLGLAALFAAAAAALWMHYLAILAVGAVLLLAFVRRRGRSAVALAAALAAFAPWWPILAAQPPQAMAWLRETPSRSLLGFFSALGGVGRIPTPFADAPVFGLLEVAGALVGVFLAVSTLSAARRDEPARDALLFVAIVLALALAASLWRPIAFAGRSEMAVLPVWLWALARSAPARRATAAAAGVAVALGLVATLLVTSAPHPRSTASAAVERVSKLARPGDVVLAGPGFHLPAALAADRGRLPARVRALPKDDAAHPGWFVAWPLRPEDVADAEKIASAVGPGRRLFLLLPPEYSRPALMDPLARRGTLHELVRQPDGVLTVWTPGLAKAPAGSP